MMKHNSSTQQQPHAFPQTWEAYPQPRGLPIHPWKSLSSVPVALRGKQKVKGLGRKSVFYSKSLVILMNTNLTVNIAVDFPRGQKKDKPGRAGEGEELTYKYLCFCKNSFSCSHLDIISVESVASGIHFWIKKVAANPYTAHNRRGKHLASFKQRVSKKILQ